MLRRDLGSAFVEMASAGLERFGDFRTARLRFEARPSLERCGLLFDAARLATAVRFGLFALFTCCFIFRKKLLEAHNTLQTWFCVHDGR